MSMATTKKTQPKADSPEAKTKTTEKSAIKKSASDIFAVIETGGKQYLVKEGQSLNVEKLPRPPKGDTITFDKVLLVFEGKDAKIGAPYVADAKVTAKLEGEIRGKKITVLRYKSKTRYSKKKGHRQTYTKLNIIDIK